MIEIYLIEPWTRAKEDGSLGLDLLDPRYIIISVVSTLMFSAFLVCHFNYTNYGTSRELCYIVLGKTRITNLKWYPPSFCFLESSKNSHFSAEAEPVGAGCFCLLGARAGAAWKKNEEPEPLGKKSQEPERVKISRLLSPARR